MIKPELVEARQTLRELVGTEAEQRFVTAHWHESDHGLLSILQKVQDLRAAGLKPRYARTAQEGA